jgi:hypothetical protein
VGPAIQTESCWVSGLWRVQRQKPSSESHESHPVNRASKRTGKTQSRLAMPISP